MCHYLRQHWLQICWWVAASRSIWQLDSPATSLVSDLFTFQSWCFIAAENGNECRCGNTLASFSTGDARCDKRCPGEKVWSSNTPSDSEANLSRFVAQSLSQETTLKLVVDPTMPWLSMRCSKRAFQLSSSQVSSFLFCSSDSLLRTLPSFYTLSKLRWDLLVNKWNFDFALVSVPSRSSLFSRYVSLKRRLTNAWELTKTVK